MTSKTQTLTTPAKSAVAATFAVMAAIALTLAPQTSNAAPRAAVDVRIGVGQSYHSEGPALRADPIFRRISETRARIDRLSDRRLISRFEARRYNDNLDEIAFDARAALKGHRTDHRLLASADMRLERLDDRLEDKRFHKASWRY
jgi:hypothetical protein